MRQACRQDRAAAGKTLDALIAELPRPGGRDCAIFLPRSGGVAAATIGWQLLYPVTVIHGPAGPAAAGDVCPKGHDRQVVTRFAPSPTGFLHIGGARTALFNWLYARGRAARCCLRIEDTDRERSTEAAIDAILDGLTWLGLDWDGEPVYQFARADRHREVAEQLLAAGQRLSLLRDAGGTRADARGGARRRPRAAL